MTIVKRVIITIVIVMALYLVNAFMSKEGLLVSGLALIPPTF